MSYKLNEYLIHKATKNLWQIYRISQHSDQAFLISVINNKWPSYWASYTNLDKYFEKLNPDTVELLYRGRT